MKGSFWGRRACMHVGSALGSPCCLGTNRISGQPQPEKNGRGGSKRQDPLSPPCQVCTAGLHCLPRVCWATKLSMPPHPSLPASSRCAGLPSEALVRREANPKRAHCLQVGPHLLFPLQHPANPASPVSSVWLQGKAAVASVPLPTSFDAFLGH